MSISDWRGIVSSTTTPALSGENGNGDKAASEYEVEEYAKERKESNPPQKARQDNGECCVDDGTAGHTLNCLLPSWNGSVVFGVVCQASATSNKNVDDVHTCEIP